MGFFAEVLNHLQVLNECITQKPSGSASLQQSWLAFHAKLPALGGLGIEKRLLAFLATCVFEACLRRSWPERNQIAGLLDTKVSLKDYDIILYIGGSAISKSKFHGKKASYLKCLELLESTQEDAAHANLTNTKDRGGLTFIGERTFNMFKKAEGLFKRMQKDEKVHKDTYVQQCKDLIKEDFIAILSDDDEVIPASVIDNVLHDLMVKYRKIRIHHHSKIVMEKLATKRQKDFRKTLHN